jgi:hypothetical protein
MLRANIVAAGDVPRGLASLWAAARRSVFMLSSFRFVPQMMKFRMVGSCTLNCARLERKKN